MKPALRFAAAAMWVLVCAIPATAAFTVGGDPGEVSPADPSTWKSGTYGYIGQTGGLAGSLIVDAGSSLRDSVGFLGYVSGSTGTAIVTGAGSTWGGPLYVGYAGTGALRVEDAGQVSSNYGEVGCNYGSTGTAIVTGAGSTWINDSLYVGLKGAGSLTVADGGKVTDNGGVIGDRAGSTGTAIVTGAGSTWTNNWDLFVGREGTGSLTVENGGAVNAQTLYAAPSDLKGNGTINVKGLVSDTNLVFDATHGTTLAFGSGGTLNLNLDGTGSLGAGYRDAGSLTIADGVTIQSLRGYIGYLSGSSGAVTVTGAGSAWIYRADMSVGQSGSGSLTVQNGGTVSSLRGSSLGWEAGSSGTAVVTGAGSTWTNNGMLYVGMGGSGALTVANGGMVSSTSGYIGYFAGSSGTAIVTGAGSTWTNSGDLYVGLASPAGPLTVENGGVVNARSLWAAPGDLKGNGTINVTGLVSDVDLVFDATHGTTQTLSFGTGGTLNLTLNGTGLLGAGKGGNGSITIADGVMVSASLGYLGCDAGSYGVVTVSGAGSRWFNELTLCVGTRGTGVLKVENGGAVRNGTGYVGEDSGAAGTASITGAGSSWTNAGILYVGEAGRGSLTVAGGATVISMSELMGDASYLGSSAGSSGTVLVTGAGSIWTSEGRLYVGYSGSGTLTVADGGKVTARASTSASNSYAVSINSQSAVNLRVSGDGMLVLGGASDTGSISNNGKVNLYADAFLAAGTYSPIAEYSGRTITWTGTGSYNATGGVWNATSHTFTVAAATALSAGASDAVTTGERLLFTDAASGQRVGASFAAVADGVTFSAARMNEGELLGLAPADGTSVLAAWDFTTNFTGGSALLAFDIGLGAYSLDVWHYDGTSWTAYDASDLIYDAHGVASFTVSGFSGYAITGAVPEPATLSPLMLGAMAMLRRRRIA